MNLIDMHCDMFWKMSEGNTDFCVDLEKLQKAESVAEFFACFIYTDGTYEGSFEKAMHMLSVGKTYLKQHSDKIEILCSKKDFRENQKKGKLSAVLTIEEGGILEGDMSRLEQLWEQDIRLMTLLWNYENCIGYPNSKDKRIMEKGLKPFGFEVVERMNELGMMIDVSHMSDGGFWDVLKHSKKPIVASHSNARSLCRHPRNLSDDMIRAVAEKDGLIGVNFYPYFVNENGIATAEDIVRHIQHIICVGGEDVVAIGTDFDGFDEGQLEIEHIGQMEVLYKAMKKAGMKESLMEKIGYKNVMKIFNFFP